MSALTEGRHAGGFIVSEANGFRSRSVVSLAALAVVAAGQILGEVTATVPDEIATEVTARAGNGGNGVLTMADPPTGEGVKAGVYQVVITSEASNGGGFIVLDPDGELVDSGSVAVAFDDVIRFTLADGGDDFDVGDSFAIRVTISADATLGAFAPWDPDADDGTEVARAIAFDNGDASDGAAPLVILARDCEVAGVDLVWPDELDGGAQSAAIAALAEVGILVR